MMQLPDETVEYQYQGMLTPQAESWSPLAELQSRQCLVPSRVRAIQEQVTKVRSQVASERDLTNPSPELTPLQAGFIDLPQKLLDAQRRKPEGSELGQITAQAAKLREWVDRVVVLGIGGSYLGARALFEGLRHSYHNEMPAKSRMGTPCVYFEGNNLDNDAFQNLLDLLENTCVDPEIRAERWGVVVISKSGGTLETAAAYRVLRGEMARFYGPKPESLRQAVVPVTGPAGKLRDLCKADGFSDAEVLTIPDNVGGRYSVFTAAGLLPAAVMGLDVRALLLGAAAMTRRFLEEPFDRNPVL